jgi:hypothetical protein
LRSYTLQELHIPIIEVDPSSRKYTWQEQCGPEKQSTVVQSSVLASPSFVELHT